MIGRRLAKPQVIVVDPPGPSSVTQTSGPPYSGSRQVRESFLRGLLGCDEIQRITDLGIQDRVLFFANPDETKRHLIYSGADVFVSPANSFQ
jgi:glycosyltransferase involved in cell wall biosynthesis